MLNYVASQIKKVAIHDWDRKKINSVSDKSFRYYNLIDYFSPHLYIVNFS